MWLRRRSAGTLVRRRGSTTSGLGDRCAGVLGILLPRFGASVLAVLLVELDFR